MSSRSLKISLRREKRAARLELTLAHQQHAARQLARQAKRFAPLQQATFVASYSAFGGEISPHLLQHELNAQLFMPRITNFRNAQMRFYKQPRVPKINTLGIQEPNGLGQPFPPRHLDAVLVPLVAFQRDGARLGMGAGFYDRAFSFRANNGNLIRPLLIGLAHSFQETDQLISEAWDVPLDAIITDQELIVVEA